MHNTKTKSNKNKVNILNAEAENILRLKGTIKKVNKNCRMRKYLQTIHICLYVYMYVCNIIYLCIYYVYSMYMYNL